MAAGKKKLKILNTV